jgi:hypothetical protein
LAVADCYKVFVVHFENGQITEKVIHQQDNSFSYFSPSFKDNNQLQFVIKKDEKYVVKTWNCNENKLSDEETSYD